MEKQTKINNTTLIVSINVKRKREMSVVNVRANVNLYQTHRMMMIIKYNLFIMMERSVPNGCNGNNECTANLRWSVSGRGSFLRLRLEALLRDLPSYAMYIALGFSNDEYMGDDTVLECIYNGIDEGRAYLSYNDGTYNAQLYEATAILIVNSSFTVNDNTFACLLDVDFKQLYRLSNNDKSKVHNLLAKPYYLQFVRGLIEQHTYVKKMHSLSDGSLYPWITTTMINMLRNKNGKYEYVKNARQAKWFSRNTTWWFLLSNAILLSRHFKTFWPNIQIDHMPIWFQLHRGGALISIMLQTVAILLIFIQSRFQFYLWCTRQCTIEEYFLQHRIIKRDLADIMEDGQLFLLAYICVHFPPRYLLLAFWMLIALKKWPKKVNISNDHAKNARIFTKVETIEIADEEIERKFCWVKIIRLSVLIIHVIISFAVCLIITAMYKLMS
uniref:DOMON domain-containing protein n=2 Tax=Wuchereria bancrofti TaxID=6293 RepID=A0A1I8ERR1_WUCBA